MEMEFEWRLNDRQKAFIAKMPSIAYEEHLEDWLLVEPKEEFLQQHDLSMDEFKVAVAVGVLHRMTTDTELFNRLVYAMDAWEKLYVFYSCLIRLGYMGRDEMSEARADEIASRIQEIAPETAVAMREMANRWAVLMGKERELSERARDILDELHAMHKSLNATCIEDMSDEELLESFIPVYYDESGEVVFSEGPYENEDDADLRNKYLD